MDVVRKVFLWVAGFLLGPALLLVIGLWGFNRTIGNPEYVKQVFRDTEIYSSISDFIIEEIQSRVGTGGEKEIVNKVIADTLKPELVENVAVAGVDVAYDILHGKTDPKGFKLDISPLTKELIQSTKVRLKERLLTLRPCNSGNPPASINPYDFNCLPFGSSIDAFVEGAVILTQLDNDILRTGTVDLNTLNLDKSKNDNKKQIEQNIQNLRNISSAYQTIQGVYWIAIIVTLISAALVVFLSKQVVVGVKRVGIILLGNGVMIVVIGLVVRFTVDRIITSDESASVPMKALQRAGNQLVGDYAFEIMKFGLIVSILGGALALSAHLMIRKQNPPVPTDESGDKPVQSENIKQKIPSSKPKKTKKNKTATV